MDILLNELHTMSTEFNPPATPDDLLHLTTTLNCTLPESLRALYRAHNGQKPTQNALVFRLLSIPEVINAFHYGSDFWYGLPTDARVFFADEQGNYAFAYVAGPLTDKVGLYPAIEPICAPDFRSVPSFLMHVIASSNSREGFGGLGMSRDYPALRDLQVPAALAKDRALFAQFREAYSTATDAEARYDLACVAMNLLPYQDSDQLTPFAQDPAGGVAEQACVQLGIRQWQAAVPLLRQVALERSENPRNAAVMALGMIGSPAASQALVDFLLQTPTCPQVWSAAEALQQHLFTVVLESDGTGRLRANHKQPWQDFPQGTSSQSGDA